MPIMQNTTKNNRPAGIINKRSFALIALCLLPVFLSAAGLAQAAGSWQLQFNLTSPERKAPFLMITSLYIDPARERYYVVEAGGNKLHSFDFAGGYLNTFGPEGALLQPFAMGKSESGELWVVEKGRNSLTEIDLKGQQLTPKKLAYGGAEVYPDQFNLAGGIFYILDKSTGNIIKYDRELSPLMVYRSPADGAGFVDFIVRDQTVWALDAGRRRVHAFGADGSLDQEIDLTGYDFEFPVALEIGSSGFVYILDKHRGSVAVFDGTGTYKYSFLEKGHGRDGLYYPEDIVFDPLGRLCVIDAGNGRVAVYSR